MPNRQVYHLLYKEFLGPFKLQLLHMKMKKICQDYGACMKQEMNFDDNISLPWMAALTRVKVSNKARELRRMIHHSKEQINSLLLHRLHIWATCSTTT